MVYGTIYARQDEECGQRGQECGSAEDPQGTAYQFVTGPMTGEALNAAFMASRRRLSSALWAPSCASTWAAPSRTGAEPTCAPSGG